LRAIVLLSGGVDSAVALYWAQAQGWEVFPLEYEYFDRPEGERKACAALRSESGLHSGITVPVPFLREISDIRAEDMRNPALREAPQGYIPLRNLIFYSLAGYHAEIQGARYVVGGHNRTDCESFPDAGAPFWEQLNRIYRIAIWSHPAIHTEVVLPLIGMDKSQVIRLGTALRVPFDLTWSCYFNTAVPCGTCESCLERSRAIAANEPAGAP
jgi:7-cyano-7-deazaguanine synthase